MITQGSCFLFIMTSFYKHCDFDVSYNTAKGADNHDDHRDPDHEDDDDGR